MPSLALYLTTFAVYAAATGAYSSSPYSTNPRLSLHDNRHLLAKLARLHIDIRDLRPPLLWSHKTLFFVPQFT